jgi:signal transduction histidine kinase
MNLHLQNILDSVQSNEKISAEEKDTFLKALKKADNDFTITEFKLDRTEKVKRTTAILLEETIEELEQKRKAVEAQNRELEIESSLEKVRTVAMGMRKSDDLLEICKIVYSELQYLRFSELRNVMINIHNDDKHALLNYDFSDNFGKTVTDIPYNFHPLVEKQVAVTRNAQDAFFEFSFTGEELKQFRELRKRNGEQDDPKLEVTDALHYYFFSIGTGSIGISTYSFINEEKLALLKRFRNVFNLSYQRYTDISQAEAQAREAEIELALERIRARTMAMQKSAELTETSYLLFQQLKELGASADQLSIGIINEAEQTMELSVTLHGSQLQNTLTVKLDEPFVVSKAYAAWKLNKKSLVVTLTGKDLEDYNAYRNNLGKIKFNKTDADVKWVVNCAFFSKGWMSFSSLENVPAETIKLLERFTAVFDGTYTRFLDLQKAEAQTREAQINLAVERVRARALAMFKSDEILEVVFKLKEEVMNLDIPGVAAATIHLKEKNGLHRMWDLSSFEQNGEKMHLPLDIVYKLEESDPNLYIRKIWGNTEQYFLVKQDKKDLKITTDWLRSNGKVKQADEADQFINSVDFTFLYHPTIQLNNGRMSIDLFDQAPSEEMKSILTKMGAAFDLAYKRFEDLKNSEAQLKEAQIEAALEKVRSRSLAMHKSDEIGEVVWTVVEKMKELKIELNGISLVTYIPDTKDMLHWHVNPEVANNSSSMLLPYFDDLVCNDCLEAKEKGIELLSKIYTKEQKDNYFNKAVEVSDFKYFPEELKQWVLDQPCLSFSFAIQKHSGIFLEDYAGKIFSKEDNDILIRFSRVFEQSYVRFLDLQKAEAQAREAQIEAALERTRTQSMIMQHSKELDDTLRVFHEQVLLLGIKSAFSFLWLPDEAKDKHIFWAIWEETINGSVVFKNKAINYPLDRNEPATKQCLIDWKSNEPVVSYAVPPEGVENYFAAWQELIDGVEKLRPEHFSGGLYYVEAFMKYGCFGVLVESDLKEDEKKILSRIAIEFERTYTRFLDLQKAEAQAREATIEAALEKVRSRSLSMHKSDELEEVVSVVFQKLHDLNMIVDGGVTISIYNELTNDQVHWVAAPELIKSTHFNVPYANDKIIADNIKAKKNGIEYFAKIYPFEEKNAMLNYLFEYSDYKYLPEDVKNWVLQSENYAQSIAFSHNSSIFVNSYSGILLTDDEAEILKRFAKVFEQAYIRFLDLQKAEEQNRESHIETALERVRSRTLAMHKSEELSDAAATVFHQLQVLGISQLRRSLVSIMNAEQTTWQIWYTTVEGESNTSYMAMPADGHPVAIGMKESWLKRELIHIELEGLQLKSWIEYILANGWHYPKGETPPEKFVIYGLPFSNGYLVAFTNNDISPAEIDLLRRFAKVFDQTYTRFLDLQKAEANAREAQIEAGLERVRSRTLAMQKSDELADTEAELFKQLINLGIAPNRLYIGIIKDELGLIEIWATNEDGSQIANQFNLDISRNDSVKRMYNAWKQQQKSVTIIMEGEELSTYLSYLQNEFNIPFGSGLSQKRRVQTISYFSNGLIGMASTDDQPAETTELLNRFAAVFNLTFTRFNDLKIAEAHSIQAEHDLIEITTARQSAEAALVELQSTQRQLIQSEKMASLGELTAGIAHEIQNPLNFVNNFSEVSKELLGEMKEEMVKGNLDDANEIMQDIIQNLEKINHHGKRADAIVKGMLQHSRSSSAVKEPTDINALCDEYLRLSYHGLRAKDKSFNATLKTDYDETIGKINIIPQDIGRVVLNLLTNAFYAVDEKKKSRVDGYEPTVTIATHYILPPSGQAVEIKVSDNGGGIPQKVLDKIFQPFFTTKPTGQGTGLGLSLSYDIVKAHDGELKVESKNGQGSEFIIELPIKNA